MFTFISSTERLYLWSLFTACLHNTHVCKSSLQWSVCFVCYTSYVLCRMYIVHIKLLITNAPFVDVFQTATRTSNMLVAYSQNRIGPLTTWNISQIECVCVSPSLFLLRARIKNRKFNFETVLMMIIHDDGDKFSNSCYGMHSLFSSCEVEWMFAWTTFIIIITHDIFVLYNFKPKNEWKWSFGIYKQPMSYCCEQR